ncbi:MAG: hypothetical protein MI750_00625 [Xanthomonadales bacterium]|nr:hypothetical protein [Xanthomonadales bacterium]
MKRIAGFLCVLVIFTLSACSGIDSNIREYDGNNTLANNEGYVIFGSKSANPALKFEFLKHFDSYITQAYIAGEDHHMLILPEGEYCFSTIYSKTTQFKPYPASSYHGWDFKVEAGKINYFGELILDGNNMRKYYDFSAIQARVQQDYPEIAEQYGFVEASL